MENNFDSLYNTARSIIKQNISFDINKDAKYRNILQKITDTLYSKNPSKNPTYLNSMIIEKAVPILTKTIKNDTSSRDVPEMVNRPLFSTPRPAFTRNINGDANNVIPDSRFTALSMQSVDKRDPNEFNRVTNITSRDKNENVSIVEKMQQLEGKSALTVQLCETFVTSRCRSGVSLQCCVKFIVAEVLFCLIESSFAL